MQKLSKDDIERVRLQVPLTRSMHAKFSKVVGKRNMAADVRGYIEGRISTASKAKKGT